MKALQFLLRAGVSLSIAIIISLSSAMIFFDYSGYKTNSDRAFLIAMPALAIAFLLFEAFPGFRDWVQRRQIGILSVFAALAMLGAAAVVLPVAVSPVSYLGLPALALILFASLLPVIPAVERVRAGHSMRHYFFGFLCSLVFAYGAVGFLSDVLKTTFNMMLFVLILILVGSVFGYYLVRRASRSLRDGFLQRPLNVILCSFLPFFLAILIYIGARFPTMFVTEYIAVPGVWFGLFIAGALVAGAWGVGVLEQFEARGLHQRFRETKLFSFMRENLPGFYAGGMFFLVNLIIARALNHPALDINTVLFEADAGPWMIILGHPASDAINRSVHPLVLIIARPLVRFVALFLADQWRLAPMLVAAALSGLCVLMAWIFVKRAAGADTYAFIFATMLGSTAAHLFFGSLAENYVYGMTALIFFFLLIQANERRFSVLVPAGLFVFGITISNIAQAAIGLFFNKFGFRRVVRFCAYIIAAGVALTALTSMLHPDKQTFFFVPGDIAFEANFVRPVDQVPASNLIQRFELVSRTMFFYGVVGPQPIEDISRKDPAPTIDLKTFNARENTYASYKGFANIPLGLWMLLLAGSFGFFVKGLRSSPHLPLMLGLLGSLTFNFLLHMNYGSELFLYTPYWMYALIFFIALSYAGLAGRKWFESLLTIFLLTLMINNVWFIFLVLRGLAPFFAAS